ncbi:ATP-binding cassette domain-containing protein [Coprococcus eutactus]|uniref:ABC transporter ATP-binding protein n=1 Tax=Coprococcus eutactus TaxID=33043 RepID=UPI001C023A1D|nr:energy-coupling factor transporter ATPase [Coprococcus eutactus]MBT9753841.1 ATP-binding cassette domain-containing protein [Coprococcus eutactus]
MSFINIKGLSHKFNIKDKDGNKVGENWAVKDVDFLADKGEMIAILGRNGSGKSTFARHLNGLLVPQEGTVIIGGQDLSKVSVLSSIRRQVGMVFQNPDNQIVGNTLAEDVGFGLENLGMSSADIWDKIDEMLELTGLAAYKYSNTSRISGGQKQKLAIASAMAMMPECIVLDEATSMLDPQGARDMLELVQKLHREKNITVIMVTHKISEALMADRVYILDNSKIVAEGTPEDVFTDVERLKKYGLEIPVRMKLEAGIPVDICSEYKKKHLQISQDAGVSADHIGDSGNSLSNSRRCIVELQNVSYSYMNGNEEYKALSDIDLKIYEGQVVSVIGQTGSGKSTLLQMINKLIAPQSGHVYLYETDVQRVRNIKDIRRRIGYVFQFPESQLFENTVLKDVMYGPINFGMSKEEAERAAENALDLVGVPKKYADYSPFELSGGLKKRVAIAGILAYEPEILILDEPACGLDGESREQLWNLIRTLNREKNVTIILVSHDMEDVYEMSERVLLMDHGRIVYDGGTVGFFDDKELLDRYGIETPDGFKMWQNL